jgi:hypothetical protein
MALTVFMCGHGSWKPSDGYVMMPKGVSMTFIVHHAKLLYTTDMYEVCSGTYGKPSDRTVGEFQSCANMSWTRDEDSKVVECESRAQNNMGAAPACVVFPNHYGSLQDNTGTIKLGDWLRASDSEFRTVCKQHGSIRLIWNCCAHMDLKSTSFGGEIGMNAAQGQDKYTHIDMTSGIKFLSKTSSL